MDVRLNALQAVEEAKHQALSKEELDAIKDEQDLVTLAFLQGEVGAREFNQRVKELDVKAGAVLRRDTNEYSDVLRAAGFSEEEVQETIVHEQGHTSVARSFGLDPFYQLQIARTSTGFAFYPSVNFDFPDSMSDEEQREILVKVITAVEDLSGRDQSQLGLT